MQTFFRSLFLCMISQDIFLYMRVHENKLVIALLRSSFGLVASGQGRKKRD